MDATRIAEQLEEAESGIAGVTIDYTEGGETTADIPAFWEDLRTDGEQGARGAHHIRRARVIVRTANLSSVAIHATVTCNNRNYTVREVTGLTGVAIEMQVEERDIMERTRDGYRAGM